MAKSSRRHRGNCESQSPQKRRVGGGPVDGSGERLYVDISWKREWWETRKKLVQELAMLGNRRDKSQRGILRGQKISTTNVPPSMCPNIYVDYTGALRGIRSIR